MSYRREMTALAQHLSGLISQGALVPERDLQIAVAGHAASITVLRRVCADLTGAGTSPHTPRPALSDLDVRPDWVLARLLDRQPILDAGSTIAVLAQAPSSPAGTTWHGVLRAATLADLEWQEADPTTRPRHSDTAWSEIADMAALSRAVVQVTVDLQESLRAGGRTADAAALSPDTGLTSVAALICQMASTRDLALPGPVLPRASTRVVTVRHHRDVPAALHRLAHLLDSACEISPGRTARIAQIIAQTASTTAAALTSTPIYRSHATSLHHLADTLARAGQTAGHLASLLAGDPGPMEQAQQISLHLHARRRLGTAAPGLDEARCTAAFLPTAVGALNRAAHRQITTRRWYTPSGTARWRPCPASRPWPALVEGLHQAAFQAQQLAPRLSLVAITAAPFRLLNGGGPPATTQGRPTRPTRPGAGPRNPIR